MSNLIGKYVKQRSEFCLNERTEPYLAENLYKDSSTLFFCEGYHDALAIDSTGTPAISMGTCKIPQSFIDNYHHQLKKFSQLIICFDSEDSGAGEEGMHSLVRRLIKKGLTNIYIAQLILGKDKEKLDISEYLAEVNEDHRKDRVIDIISELSIPLHDYLFQKHSVLLCSKSLTNDQQIEQEKILIELLSYLELLPVTTRLRVNKMLAKNMEFDKSEFNKLVKGLTKEINVEKEELNKESDTAKLIKTFISELWTDQHKKAYASIYVDEHIENWPLTSETFNNSLISHYFKHTGVAPSDKVLKDMISLFKARALQEKAHDTHIRCAEIDGNIYLDVCDKKWTIIKINKSGIKEINDSGIKFIRYNHMKPLLYDLNGDLSHIDSFLDLYNLEDGEKQLIKCYIATLFFPKTPTAILQVHGAQGSGKSEFQKAMRRIIDPSSLEALGLPKENESELIQQISHHYFPVYDNVSKISTSYSDMFCKVITGAGVSKRELFTTDEDFILHVIRKIAMNGINLSTTRSDFLDRCLNIVFGRIPKGRRMTLKELYLKQDKLLPLVVGAYLKVAQKMLFEIEKISVKELPRLADFSINAEAGSRALGYTELSFFKLYWDNIGEANSEALQGSVVATLIIKYVETRVNDWKNSKKEIKSSDLLKMLQGIALETGLADIKNKSFPKTSNKVSRQMNEIDTNLSDIGIKITKEKRRDAKYYIIDASAWLENKNNEIKAIELLGANPQLSAGLQILYKNLGKSFKISEIAEVSGLSDTIFEEIDYGKKKGYIAEIRQGVLEFTGVKS